MNLKQILIPHRLLNTDGCYALSRLSSRMSCYVPRNSVNWTVLLPAPQHHMVSRERLTLLSLVHTGSFLANITYSALDLLLNGHSFGIFHGPWDTLYVQNLSLFYFLFHQGDIQFVCSETIQHWLTKLLLFSIYEWMFLLWLAAKEINVMIVTLLPYFYFIAQMDFAKILNFPQNILIFNIPILKKFLNQINPKRGSMRYYLQKICFEWKELYFPKINPSRDEYFL